MTMNRNLAVSAVALTVAAGGAWAQDVSTSSFSAGVALMAPNETGFLYGAQLGVDGVGSGAVTVTSSAAQHNFLGQAASGTLDPVGGTPGATLQDASSGAGVLGTFDFIRSVATTGSLAGVGNVIAEGEALGASGFAGAAFANATSTGVENIAAGDAPIVAGTLTKSTEAAAESEAGVSGSLATRNRLSLGGSSSNFAGSLGTRIGETNETISYSFLESTAGDAVSIPSIATSTAAGAVADFGEGEAGVAFSTDSELAGGEIDLAIASSGGGSQSLSVSTGGFFTGGASAFGENDFNETFAAD